MDFSNWTNWIKSKRSDILALMKLLVSIKSMSPENGGDGEWERVQALNDWLKVHGFLNQEIISAPDERVTKKSRPNLVVTVDGSTRQVLWVIAHTDTVPVGDEGKWITPPLEMTEKDGKLFGRGCEDNLQGLVSAVFSALYLIENNITPKKTIKILFAADEEVGSAFGVKYLLSKTNIFLEGDEILIPDGGDSKGETIEIAEKSILWLSFTVTGKETHASRPDNGENATLIASDLTMRLYRELHRLFPAIDDMFSPNKSTFQPTKRLSNVDTVNIIPGLDKFSFDCRILPCYKTSDVLEEINLIIRATEKDYPKSSIKIEILQKTESPSTSPSSSIVKRLSQAVKLSRSLDTKTIGIGGGTVAGDLRSRGFPCVVWSTLDETAHTYNEYCIIENIFCDAKTMALLFILD